MRSTLADAVMPIRTTRASDAHRRAAAFVRHSAIASPRMQSPAPAQPRRVQRRPRDRWRHRDSCAGLVPSVRSDRGRKAGSDARLRADDTVLAAWPIRQRRLSDLVGRKPPTSAPAGCSPSSGRYSPRAPRIRLARGVIRWSTLVAGRVGDGGWSAFVAGPGEGSAAVR